MTCPACRGSEMEPGKTDLAYLVAGEPVVLLNVPALICANCGEVILPADSHRAIERLVLSKSATRTVPARVYYLAAEHDLAEAVSGVTASS